MKSTIQATMMAAGTPAKVTHISDDFIGSHGRKGLLRPLDGYVKHAGFNKAFRGGGIVTDSHD
ncbi:MAG: hypothetical protein HY332_18820 [Chloroflexi bacterium]|nr:hypothetical protein [Chloroflexota bacterium]